MKSVATIDFLGLILRSVLAVIIVTIGLGLTGCNEQMTRIEDNQLKLEVMIEANAEQIAIMAANMEQNQYDIEARVGNVHNEAKGMAADFATITDTQMKLREFVQSSNRGLYNRISGMEQTQRQMHVGIEDVQSDTKSMVSNVTAVSDEQTRLHEIVQNNGSYMADRMDVIEQKQQQWQNMFNGLRDNIQKVVSSVDILEQNLSGLQEIVQNSMQNLISVMDSASRERMQYREEVESNIQDMFESLDAIQQNQFNLRSQIENVQQTTETMKNDMPQALEYLKEEELSRSMELTEFNKPVALFSPIETNSVPQ